MKWRSDVDIFANMQIPLVQLRPGTYNVQSGTFGVEIECEGRNLPERVPGWVAHRDGSLRGEALEYVTSEAVTRLGLSRRLDLLDAAFKAHDTRVDVNSFRCSTHIHRNMQHESMHTLMGTLVVFSILEPLFMRLCGETRDGNLFCLPSYDCGDLAQHVHRWLVACLKYGATYPAPRGKYSDLNLNTIETLGTLEFRAFKCSITKDEILKWSDWVDGFVNKARQSKYSAFLGEVREAKESPVSYATSVLGFETVNTFLKTNGVGELQTLILMGCESAWELCREYSRFQRKLRKDK